MLGRSLFAKTSGPGWAAISRQHAPIVDAISALCLLQRACKAGDADEMARVIKEVMAKGMVEDIEDPNWKRALGYDVPVGTGGDGDASGAADGAGLAAGSDAVIDGGRGGGEVGCPERVPPEVGSLALVFPRTLPGIDRTSLVVAKIDRYRDILLAGTPILGSSLILSDAAIRACLSAREVYKSRNLPPLELAAFNGHDSVVRLLVLTGAGPDGKGSMDWRLRQALGYAAAYGQVQVVRTLLAALPLAVCESMYEVYAIKTLFCNPVESSSDARWRTFCLLFSWGPNRATALEHLASHPLVVTNEALASRASAFIADTGRLTPSERQEARDELDRQLREMAAAYGLPFPRLHGNDGSLLSQTTSASSESDSAACGLQAMIAKRDRFAAHPETATLPAVLHAVARGQVVDVSTLVVAHTIVKAAALRGVLSPMADDDLYFKLARNVYGSVIRNGPVDLYGGRLAAEVVDDARRARLLSRDAALALCLNFKSHTIGQEGLAAVRQDMEDIKTDQRALIRAGQEIYCNVAELRQALDAERRQRRKVAVATSVVKIAISAMPLVGASLSSGVEAIAEILQGLQEDEFASAVAVRSFLKEATNVQAVRDVLEAAPLALAAVSLQYLDGALEDLTMDDLRKQIASLADRPGLWLPTNGDGVEVSAYGGGAVAGPSSSRPLADGVTSPVALPAAALEETADSAGYGANNGSGPAEQTDKILETVIDEVATHGTEWGVEACRGHHAAAAASGGDQGIDAGGGTAADDVSAGVPPASVSSLTGRSAEGVVTTCAACSNFPLPFIFPAAAEQVSGLFDGYEATMTSLLVANIHRYDHKQRKLIIASMRAAVLAVERDDAALERDADCSGMKGRQACTPLQPTPDEGLC